MVLFALLKRIVIVMALFYVVVYGLPYIPYVGEYIQSFFEGTKDTVTGFAARKIVAPIAEVVAENAQGIADSARDIGSPQASVPKTSFFPSKNTQVDRPHTRNNPSPSTSPSSAANPITSEPPNGAGSDASTGVPEKTPELAPGCCACN
ncbi:hypothetical protein HY485_03295 [Candidatus Woesearchaeota archaeon]|nr:hypothetical protein [Candidatus Woesearchaeota archaeon]